MTIENSIRYLGILYSILIIACGIATLSRASFTLAQSTHPLLLSSGRPERPRSIAPIANGCRANHSIFSNDNCRTMDGGFGDLISFREPIADFR